MVKPHGYLLDFVGIFDTLEKALAFDSDEINAIVKDLKLLKVLFKDKMESQAPEYLGLFERYFNDKDDDTSIESPLSWKNCSPCLKTQIESEPMTAIDQKQTF